MERTYGTADVQAMKNEESFKTTLILFLKIEAIALFLIWLSSYVQLSIFSNEAFNSTAWKKVYMFLSMGIVIDLYSMYLAIYFGMIKKTRSSLIPMISWIMYFLFSFLYGKPLFLFFDTTSILLLSVFKTVEFFVLSFCDFIWMYIAGSIINNNNNNRHQ